MSRPQASENPAPPPAQLLAAVSGCRTGRETSPHFAKALCAAPPAGAPRGPVQTSSSSLTQKRFCTSQSRGVNQDQTIAVKKRKGGEKQQDGSSLLLYAESHVD